MDALAARNILTRRANQWHVVIIPQFGNLPAVLRNGALCRSAVFWRKRW